jgi:alpha-beta hydrolase superfamily lysophospholipase
MDEARRARRRWPLRTLVGVLSFLVIFHLAGGWYFSGVIHDRALSGEDRRASTDFDPDLTVAAIDGDTIVLRAADGSEAPPSLSLDGTWGLRWADGYGQVGEVLRANDDGVARTFELLDGEAPEAGDATQLDPRAYADPAMAGLEVDDVQIDGPLGTYPAWFVDGDRTTWVIVVHGNSMSRLDNVRWLPALHEAGYPTLTITYRNDGGAPEDPSGLLRYGLTEWEDLDAAARYALDEGAEDIVLFGDSMGAGVISAFLQRSDLSPSVRAMVFDAPMVDFSQTVDDNAAREPLIGPIDVPPTLTWTAKWLTELRFDVDWEALDYLDDPSIYGVPTLVLHGTDDLTIPIATSEQLAADAPGTVTLIECPGADHIECWNLDPAGYEDRVISFLEAAPTA